MIDIEKLNLFLEEANHVIKSSIGTYQKLKPLCKFEASEGEKAVSFGIELRGYVREDEAFFLVACIGDSNDKFISRGYFTKRGGHYASFAMTHDEPRGMNIQQGVLIEMRNILSRMVESDGMSDFATKVLGQLEKMQVKVQVVKSDEDILSAVDEAGLGAFKAEVNEEEETIGKLEIKSDKPLCEQKADASVFELDEAPEDIVGHEFAKSVGNKEDALDEDNPLDLALKNTQVYRIERDTAWKRIVKFFRRMLRLDKEREELNNVCSEMFGEKESR